MAVSSLHLPSRPYASESLGHTGFDPPSLRALAVLASLPLRILASLISRCCSSSSTTIYVQKQNKNNINTWRMYLGIS